MKIDRVFFTFPEEWSPPSYIIDAELEMLKDSALSILKNRSLVHFHTGTTELTGFCSYARNEATEHSDIDLVIVLEGKIAPGREIDRSSGKIFTRPF